MMGTLERGRGQQAADVLAPVPQQLPVHASVYDPPADNYGQGNFARLNDGGLRGADIVHLPVADDEQLQPTTTHTHKGSAAGSGWLPRWCPAGIAPTASSCPLAAPHWQLLTMVYSLVSFTVLIAMRMAGAKEVGPLRVSVGAMARYRDTASSNPRQGPTPSGNTALSFVRLHPNP